MTKLTPEDIKGLIREIRYVSHNTLTIAIVDLENGATVTGESNVINPENWDQELGQKFALEKAINKIWELEGYACKTRGFPAT